MLNGGIQEIKLLRQNQKFYGGQSINYESNSEYESKKRFIWKANTTFTFKTWVFPGLNSLDEQPQSGIDDIDGLIKYFNFYPLAYYDGNPEYDEENGNTQYPVFGDLYNRENAGFFAVDTDQEFYNDGSDPQGILDGKYAVNNIESDPSSILYDPVSGILNPGEVMIPDLTTVGDIPSNIAYLNSFPAYKIWQDYLINDPPINEQIMFKYVYYKNGYPISSLTADIPSGDLLFNRFHSEFNRFETEKYGYNNPIISAEFGISYTDYLKPIYNYNKSDKVLSIYGIYENDNYRSFVRK